MSCARAPGSHAAFARPQRRLLFPPLLFDHAVQALQRVGKAADAVDETQLHRLLSTDHAACRPLIPPSGASAS